MKRRDLRIVFLDSMYRWDDTVGGWAHVSGPEQVADFLPRPPHSQVPDAAGAMSADPTMVAPWMIAEAATPLPLPPEQPADEPPTVF